MVLGSEIHCNNLQSQKAPRSIVVNPSLKIADLTPEPQKAYNPILLSEAGNRANGVSHLNALP